MIRTPWPLPDAPYFIIERAEQDFIQVWRTDDHAYQVEYREGGQESHFVFRTADCELVGNVMWAWTIEDPLWRTAVDWEFLDLEDDADAPRKVQLQNQRHVKYEFSCWP